MTVVVLVSELCHSPVVNEDCETLYVLHLFVQI